MASPPVLTPANTTGLNRQTWDDTVEAATQQKMLATPTYKEYPGRILNTGNVRKLGRVTGSTLAQSAEGDSLTASDFTGTPITLTPIGRYVYGAWSENEEAQVDVNIDRLGADAFERGLAETTDTAALAIWTAATQTMSGASIEATMIRQAVGRLMTNMNGEALPGDDKIMAVISTTQYPNMMAISEYNDADVRGDSENPHVKGVYGKGGGVQIMYSTVVAQDANGWHNPVYVREAAIVGWNARSRIKRQDYLLQNRIVLYNNCAFSILHDLRAVVMRTTASGL